jgi:hypothetical protein
MPKSNKHNEVAHSRELKSSLKNKCQDLDLRERERGELELVISMELFNFLSDQ